MKKLFIIFFCLVISMVFASCNINSNNNDSNDVLISELTQEEKENSTNNKNSKNNTDTKPFEDGSNIQKVIISYFDSELESTYDQEAHELFNKIKNNSEKTNIILTNKIGKISIKYINKEEKVDFAELYLGSDNNIYAKYILDTNNTDNYVYKIDTTTLS